ncbi:enoyl-CoA hydratase/isomerase family protein [Microbacterium alcoholitolerans]|uniref:enoyl-CoA hydratase/isomerase family protein n=1 Tax=unclassified Microbacterium TaxID=2609290 RepID=UPI003D17161B
MDVRVEPRLDGRVGILELSGRGGTNPMDDRFVRELDAAAAEIAYAAQGGRIDVLVIRARGRHFSVGGDLADLAQVEDPSAAMTHMTGFAHRGIATLHALEIPVIARWQGAAAGGGIGLLLVADVVVASRSASLTAGYSAVGLSPDAGVSWGLARRIGPERALELLLSNRRLDAAAILALGLASEVVDDEELDARVEARVAQVLEVGGAVLRTTKRLVQRAASVAIGDQLSEEAKGIAAAARQERFVVAVARFAGGTDGR